MKELLGYLLNQFFKFELEGIRTTLEKEFDEFSLLVMKKMEEQTNRIIKKFTYFGTIFAGFLFSAIGVSFIVDEIVGVRGGGFVIVGALVLLLSTIFKER